MRRLLGYRAARQRVGSRVTPSWGMPGTSSVRLSAMRALAMLVAVVCLGTAGCASASRAAAPRATAAATVRATPTATPTARDALILRALDGQAQSVTTAPGSGTGALVVTVTISGTVPSTQADVAAAQERVKTLCYQALHALVTGGTAAGEVTIVVQGPELDEYANHITGLYGSAIVEPQTEARLDWAHLTPDSAWSLYDHAYLVSQFYPVD